jgi:phosphoglycolate phosphatase-like HAD superfamily hydrolase
MQYAFDLDGTLVDTRKVIRDAYTHAGHPPPEDFFGKTFAEWFKGDAIEAQRVHSLKQQYYMEHAKEVRPLPLMSLFTALAIGGRAPRIFTGASYNALQILAYHFPIIAQVEWLCSLTLEAKIRTMNESNVPGIMFEDNAAAAVLMRASTEWTICCTC